MPRGEVHGVRGGSASLLRLGPMTRVYVALVAGLVLAVAAPLAAAATPAPDPSPLGGTAQPDPFPVVHSTPAPAPAPRIVRHATIDVTPESRPAPTTAATPARVVPARITPVATQHSRPAATHVKRKQTVHVERRSAFEPPSPAALRRLFQDPVQAMIPIVAGAVDPPARVSRTLAIALGLLVLLSAALVAAAAREMAH